MNKFLKLLPALSLAIAIPSLAPIANARPHLKIDGARIADISSDLNLTPEQKTKIEQLKASSRIQIEALLTPEQRQKYNALQTDRSGMKQGWQSLNLSTEQKLKIRSIRQSHRQQLQAILTPAQQNQLKQRRGKWGKNNYQSQLDRVVSALPNRLNLTAEQKTKVERLKASTRSQIEAVLTPEQRQKFTAMQNGNWQMSGSWKDLNLSADQKTKLKAIRQQSMTQFNAILTAEQQSQLKSYGYNKRQRSL